MSELELNLFDRSLCDVIRWCNTLSLGAGDACDDTLSLRRAKYKMADQLFDEARRLPLTGWPRRKIQETEQWKSAHELLEEVRNSLGPLEHTLRSAALRPTTSLDQPSTVAEWVEAVAEVVSKRSRLLGSHSSSEHQSEQRSGRLLLYFPEENLADGAADISSNGFFNIDNVPPWDIWIDFANRTLISWVPPALIEAAHLGIEANPEICIRWADEG